MINYVNLGDLVVIKGGGTPSRLNTEFWGGSIPWATVKDLTTSVLNKTQESITTEAVKNSSTNIISAGSIITATRMGLGKVAINTIDVAINQDLKALQPNKQLDNKYLLHFLLSKSAYLESLGKGATVKGIILDDLQKLQIPLPPLSQQKRIAAILDKADAIRRKRQEAIKLADDFLRATFLDMFGDPVANPKGIKIVKLSDITNKITDGVHQKPHYTKSGVPFISVKDITTGKLKFDNCKYISLEDHNKYTKRCKPERADILYTKVGATYGRPAIIDTDNEFSLYVSVCLIKPNKDLVDPYYLSATMATSAIKKQADKCIKGIGVPDLHLDQIKNFLLPLPSMNRQNEFSNRVRKIESLKTKYEKSIIEIEYIFNSLTQRAFRGDL